MSTEKDIIDAGKDISGFWNTTKNLFSSTKEHMKKFFGEKKESVTQETKSETSELKTEVDLTKSVVLENIKNGISGLYIDIKGEIPEEYFDNFEKEYSKIIEKLNGCSNDGDLKNISSDIDDKINSWINNIQNNTMGNIIGAFNEDISNLKTETINGLNSLKTILAEVNGPEAVEETKQEIAEGEKSEGENDELKNTLVEIGIPVSIAGVFATILGLFGLKPDSKTIGFIKSITSFIKNPSLDSFTGIFSDKKEQNNSEQSNTNKPETKTEENILGTITENGEFKTYLNNYSGLEIKTESKKINEITINNNKYKLNKDIEGDIDFIQRENKDYIKIGDKEQELTDLIKEIKTDNNKDNYVLIKNYNWLFMDLKLEKIS